MAIRIIQRRFGGPETLEVVEVESPTASDLGPDEVLVAAAAAGVNPIDVMTRTGGGMAATGAITMPFTPGWDVAGTVRAVGAGATGLAPGQRVLGLARFPREERRTPSASSSRRPISSRRPRSSPRSRPGPSRWPR